MGISVDVREQLKPLAKLYRLCMFASWTGVVGISLFWLTRGSQFPFIPQMIFSTTLILISGMSLLALVGVGEVVQKNVGAVGVTVVVTILATGFVFGLLIGGWGLALAFTIVAFTGVSAVGLLIVLGVMIWSALQLRRAGVRLGLMGVKDCSVESAIAGLKSGE